MTFADLNNALSQESRLNRIWRTHVMLAAGACLCHVLHAFCSESTQTQTDSNNLHIPATSGADCVGLIRLLKKEKRGFVL